MKLQGQYSFTVIASDGVNQDAQQSLTLSITDLDDTGPIITSPDQVSADENVGADAVVYTVTTNDTGPVSYELISVLQIEAGRNRSALCGQWRWQYYIAVICG